MADITYIRILTTFVYLAVILDSSSRKVIGYALSRSLDTSLTLYALKMALRERQSTPGCIHHSDQGVQYAAHEYVKELKQNSFRISIAHTENPYENAKADSFFKILKHEEVYLWDYMALDDVVKRISYFIEEVYNKKRLHSALGYILPDEFESSIAVKEQKQKFELLLAAIN